jgi:hypothetical protein
LLRMNIPARIVLSAALVLSPSVLAEPPPASTPPAAAVTRPSAEAVKQTWDYFYRGQGQGPVLIDAILCVDVAKDGPNKYECVGPLDPAAPVKVGAPVTLWQSYLVPQGDTVEDLTVQVKQGSVVRETKDVKVKGDGWRARQWTALKLTKPGEWTINLMRGEQVLKSFTLKVQ